MKLTDLLRRLLRKANGSVKPNGESPTNGDVRREPSDEFTLCMDAILDQQIARRELELLGEDLQLPTKT